MTEFFVFDHGKIDRYGSSAFSFWKFLEPNDGRTEGGKGRERKIGEGK
jgi:hypothetical protein